MQQREKHNQKTKKRNHPAQQQQQLKCILEERVIGCATKYISSVITSSLNLFCIHPPKKIKKSYIFIDKKKITIFKKIE
jgi:hypothetical protein